MKNKLFFSLALATSSLCSSLRTHELTDQQDLTTLALQSSYSTSIFEEILDNYVPVETPHFPLSLRHAHAIKEDKTFLQKLQILALRCYTTILCRYYAMQKWLSRCKGSSKQISNS